MKDRDEITQDDPSSIVFHIIAFITTLTVLLLARIVYSFLLFHIMAEIFTIIVSMTIFLFGWNTYNRLPNGFLRIIPVSFLFSGFFIILHTITYSGMNIMPGINADVPTQLWITAQVIQASSYCIGIIFFNIRLNKIFLLLIYGLVTLVLFHLVFIFKLFPECFTQGGLTPFKIIMEYIICFLFATALIAVYVKRRDFHGSISGLLFISIILSIIAELFFTVYSRVDDHLNVAGHFIRIISIYLVYWAVFETGVRQPFSMVFKNMKENEQKLTEALGRVKQLHGLLPICSSCKKIRDDKGYWNQIEEYIKDHSEAEFSHGLCPECYKTYEAMIKDLPKKTKK
ncbi:MAG: hypothetical protein JW904_05900 [Spirochaetales bacterium]|nr:hypothetical protein [Spirochaetales bacterium]